MPRDRSAEADKRTRTQGLEAHLRWFIIMLDMYPLEGVPDHVAAQLRERIKQAKALFPLDFPGGVT